MSDISNTVTATTIEADSANIHGGINSNSITNANAISTETITVLGSAQVGGNLSVNGTIQATGRIVADGGISFGTIAHLRQPNDFVIDGNLVVLGNALFSKDSMITTDTFSGTTEGVVSAHNIRAANRFILGDSKFKVESSTRTIVADTFTQNLKKLIVDRIDVATLEFETLKFHRSSDAEERAFAQLQDAEIESLLAEKAEIEDLTVLRFTASKEFATKDLSVDGSILVSGGITINGVGRNEGSLVVNDHHAVFNRGVHIYGKEGAIAQTLSIIGTTNTSGDAEAETEEGKTAFRTAIGVRSLFQGDVTVRDSKMVLDNSPLFGERITVTNLSTTRTDVPSLDICKSGYNWDSYVNSQITFGDEEVSSLPEGFRNADDIQTRGETPYVGRANDKTSKEKAPKKLGKRSTPTDLAKMARDVSVSQLTRSFTIKTDGANYRIDSAGNILARNEVVENVHANSIVTNEIVANKFRTDDFIVNNMFIDGMLNATGGLAIGGEDSGISEFNGKIYNYANIVTKGADSKMEFKEQSSQTFEDGSMLKVKAGGSLITDDDSNVSLRGDVMIDMAHLILFNSATGQKYRFVLRDATTEEADNVGDVSLEFGEIVESNDDDVVATTRASAARAHRKLSDDLEQFQAKFRRI